MKCVFCNYDLESSFQTIERRVKGQLRYISNVPVDLCTNCGEVYIDDKIVSLINEALVIVQNSQFEKTTIYLDFNALKDIQSSNLETSATMQFKQYVFS